MHDGTVKTLEYLGEQERFWMDRADQRMDLLRECRAAIEEVLRCPESKVKHVRGPLEAVLKKMPWGA